MSSRRYCTYCGNALVQKKLEGRVRNVCGTCREIIYDNPVPAVCMIVINKKKEILLVKRNQPPGKGLWCLPGGFMELGETPIDSGLRELEEETGLTGKVKTLVGVDSGSHELYDTVTLTCFHCDNYTGEMIPGDDADEARFFTRESLPEIAFRTHKRFIRIFYAGYV